MEELIGILLIVSPGFIVKKIKDLIIAKDEVKTDVENTIISVMYSIPILISNLVILKFKCKIVNIEELIDKFNNIDFILKYGILTLITMLIFTYIVIVLLKNKTNNILNKFRSRAGEPERTTSLNPWQDFFKVDTNMPVRVLKNKEVLAEGFLKHWDADGLDDKDIVLEYEEIIKDNPECFKRVKKTYYNIKNDVVIQELHFDKEFLDNN